MHFNIEQKYPGLVTIADIFAYPTIKKLSTYIGEKLNKKSSIVKDNSVDKNIDELFRLVSNGQMTAAEVANILKKRREV